MASTIHRSVTVQGEVVADGVEVEGGELSERLLVLNG